MQIILSLTLTLLLWTAPILSQSSENAVLALSLADSEDITINSSDLIYQGTSTQKTDAPDIGVRLQSEKVEMSPAKPQKFIDPSDFNNRILEKISKQFKEASAFLDDKKR